MMLASGPRARQENIQGARSMSPILIEAQESYKALTFLSKCRYA